MKKKSHEKLAAFLRAGQVYRREKLILHSNAIDRDLSRLVSDGALEKVGAGLYYKPKVSRFGKLPPSHQQLVRSFLRDEHFLIYSWNEYNSLGLGLTQLYHHVIVYNYKRHGVFKFNKTTFNFRHAARGFPKTLTREFLLVDLVNNMKELTEDTEHLKTRIRNFFHQFDNKKVLKYASLYGKVTTQQFFQQLSSKNVNIST